MTMAFSSATWHVRSGSEAAFTQRWREFLDWTAKTLPGLHHARLLADAGDSRHFVSFAEWESSAHRDAWRAHPDFSGHLQALMAMCDEASNAPYSLAVEVRPAAHAGH